MADESKRSLPKAPVTRFAKIAHQASGPSLFKGPPADPGAFATNATPLHEVPVPARLRDILAGVRDGTVRPERAQFRALLLSNPNYFGTLEEKGGGH
jgi:hypothetical protein